MILLGRVIMGDIAATLADLASRQAIIVEEASAGGWLVSVEHGFDDHGLAGYEQALLHDLPGSPGPIGGIEDSVPERARSALIHDGIARGWLRHLHHDQRTPAPKASPGSCAPSTGNCGSCGKNTDRTRCPEACCRTPSTSGCAQQMRCRWPDSRTRG